MTPSEKATELVDYFTPIVKDLEAAKKCAVKVCEEIIESGPSKSVEDTYRISINIEYWKEVIEQIKAIR